MIGNDVFHTDFREGFTKPSLRPLPWDNWDLLVGKPAAYYDFEKPPTAPKKQINNKKAGLILVLIGAVVCLALGAAFSLPFGFDFIDAVIAMYAFFGISFTFAGLLMIASTAMCEKGYAVGFGIALHYGTAILSGIILPVFGCEDPSGRMLIAFVIVAMACYIAWLSHFKNLET